MVGWLVRAPDPYTTGAADVFTLHSQGENALDNADGYQGRYVSGGPSARRPGPLTMRTRLCRAITAKQASEEPVYRLP
jgi:hypothetical protein